MWSTLFPRGAAKAAALTAMAFGLVACGGGGGGDSSPPPPPEGTIAITVTEAGSDPVTAIEGARVTVIDGDTGDIVKVLTTDADGAASLKLAPGKVQLKVSAQGYAPSPSPIGAPLPIDIVDDKTSTAAIALTALPDAANLGSISGKVLDTATKGVANALVVAKDSTGAWYSTASGPDGAYTLFNVPMDSFSVTALRAGFNFEELTASVALDLPAENVDVTATGPASGTIAGSVTFVATQNGEVDVTLIHPDTNEVIPGLRTVTTRDYALKGVPNGRFIAVASLETDGYVLDPDAVVKFGAPEVEVRDGVAYPVVPETGEATTAGDLDFKVTGAVKLTSPMENPTYTGAITFTWDQYSSTKNYVLEITNENGDFVWGGKTVLPGSDYTVGTATEATAPPLAAGTYHLRVYAADVADTTISATEDLEGVFTVAPPEVVATAAL